MDNLSPYLSLTMLQITGDEPAKVFAQIMRKLKEWSMGSGARIRALVNDGVDTSFIADDPDARWVLGDEYELDAFVAKCEQKPSWIKEDSPYIDVEHELCIVLRRNSIIGIQSQLTRDQLLRWVDEPPGPPVKRIPEGVMHAAYLQGEAKGLWLRGTHVRRSTKADSKNLSGTRLQDALLPHEDSSFAMGSARASLPTSLGLAALTGTVGTTPRKSLAWGGKASNILDYLQKADEMLMLVEENLTLGLAVDQPFPLLAVEESDLTQVRGAFDFSILHSDDLRDTHSVSTDLIEAADLLQNGIIELDGNVDSPLFQLQVGINGAIGGELVGRIERKRDGIDFKFGYNPSSPLTHEPAARAVLNALNSFAGDLLTVYYESGHTIVQRGIYRRQSNSSPFPNWEFHDFSGFDIRREKPAVPSADIHSAIGQAGDDSLFSWVAKTFSKGWLTCDDGAGEIADFIHIDEDGRLSLVHVKSAKSDHRRQVAVGPYEEVASQATKNVRYLSDSNLLRGLENSTVRNPACWVDGARVPSRESFIEALKLRSATDESRVVIVQPHVSQDKHKEICHERDTDDLSNSRDILRLALLEALLNSARATVVGWGGDLRVIGSLV
jgi:hypothetical protein